MAGSLYIETLGCQMNVLDSELLVGALKRQGYVLAEKPDQADVVLFNTCSIREHAEEKVYSALGALKKHKRENPETVIGVLGCMAQKDQDGVFRRAPHVDLVCGPGALPEIPELVEEVRRTRIRRTSFSLDRREAPRRDVEASFASWDPERDPAMRPTPFQALVRTQLGCDKFCTYCIVPRVRGPEQGRSPDEIVAECVALAGQGVVEITLIGQTVNSYRHGRTRLSDLLARLSRIEGISRIKFVTNFPNDMTDDLLAAVRDVPKISPYLHVPAQSGSDRVLARMKRHYTRAMYDEMVDRIRETLPGASISCDMIVGFCGETEEDFAASADLIRRSRFKNSFIYQYSPRPGTKAFEYDDDVPEETKKRRNNDLLAVQADVSRAEHRRFIGQTVEVLVEGASKKGRDESGDAVQLVGRTATDHIAVFDGPLSLAGRLVRVAIADASTLTLYGAVEGLPLTGPPRLAPLPPRRVSPLPVL